MATFRNRTGKWQARIRRQGHKDITKSFITLQDAEKWARQTEVDLDKHSYRSNTLAEKTALKDLVERYIREVTTTMRSVKEDTIRLNALLRKPICQINMLALTPSKIAEYRDIRLKEVKAGTVIRELCYLSSIINHARREWGINIENPTTLVKKPPSPKGRDRILTLAEKKLILDFFKTVKINHFSIWMPCIIEFALETAMRLSEITSLLSSAIFSIFESMV